MTWFLTFISTPWFAFGCGLLLGGLILIFDAMWGHRYYSEEVAPDLAHSTSTEPLLITRSIVFLLVYLPLAVYVVTSSGSGLALGVISGLGGGLSGELWQYRRHPRLFQQRFLWQIKRHFSQTEINGFVKLFVGIVSVLVLICLSFLV